MWFTPGLGGGTTRLSLSSLVGLNSVGPTEGAISP